jgi:hypothetical protein
MASKYNKKFEAQMTTFIEKAKNNMDTVKMLSIYELFCNVVDRTPRWIAGQDAGNAKWNWTVSVGSPDTRHLKGLDPNGTARKKQAYTKLASISNMPGEEDIYISNSTPYIMKLEYGEYPKRVKRGSYNPKKKGYEIRSQSGFSKQAPVGMARISSLEWSAYVADKTKTVNR